ncbi:MFS nicotinic acid transporter Tna1 [Scleroderma citrinum]
MPPLSEKSIVPENNGQPSSGCEDDVSKPRNTSQVVLSPEEERKLWKKIDLRLMPIISLMYLFSFMDRGNIGNAKLEGLMTQLHLTGHKFNVTLTTFFISYALFEFPANLIIQVVRPSRWLPSLMLVWGLIMMLMGFVKTYPQLAAVRFCLGVAEAGFFPGIGFFLTMWYPKYKLMYRIALFTGAAAAAGAFSGLLAYGIGFMNKLGGLQGWSWIFIIEGLITMLIGFIGILVLVDYPSTAIFLTTEERRFVEEQRTLNIDDEEEGTVLQRVLSAGADWQVWTLGFVLMSFMTPAYGITFFLPTILNSFGYSTPISQLLTVPIYVAATINMITVAHFSDKLKIRSLFIFALQFITLIGYIIEISNSPSGIKYFGAFLCVIGSYSGVPCALGWLANNLNGKYKRAVGLALQGGMGNLGGIVASNIFLTKEQPRYITGHAIEMGFLGVGLVMTVFTAYTYHCLNGLIHERGEENDEVAPGTDLVHDTTGT